MDGRLTAAQDWLGETLPHHGKLFPGRAIGILNKNNETQPQWNLLTENLSILCPTQWLVRSFMACLPSQLIRFLTPSDLQLACQVEPDNNMHQIETLFCWKSLLTSYQAPYIVLLFKQTYGLLPNGKKRASLKFCLSRISFVIQHQKCKTDIFLKTRELSKSTFTIFSIDSYKCDLCQRCIITTRFQPQFLPDSFLPLSSGLDLSPLPGLIIIKSFPLANSNDLFQLH